MEEHHRRIAEIALSAGERYSLALAGGYAIQAHGIGTRPSGDVDLFLDWRRRGEFGDAVAAVIEALREAGLEVSVIARGETFARLLISSPAHGVDPDKMEIAADWRSQEPVLLGIGPVLHPDDAVANKMGALYGRALPRDFLDVDAIVVSGRYTTERLLELALAADPGFEREMFASALGALSQITDAAFAEYGTLADVIAALRRRFADWRTRASQPLTSASGVGARNRSWTDPVSPRPLAAHADISKTGADADGQAGVVVVTTFATRLQAYGVAPIGVRLARMIVATTATAGARAAGNRPGR